VHQKQLYLEIPNELAVLKQLQSSTRNSVIIKASFKATNPLNNSLIVEQKIYENVCKKLLFDQNTPHLMGYLGSYNCAVSNLKLPHDVQEAFNEMRKVLEEEHYDTSTVSLLFLEQSPGKQLSKWILMNQDRRDILNVSFQILITLNCFSIVGLRQNDLHFGNIFVEELEEPIVLYYRNSSGNKYVALETTYICKIYDFDRGTIYYPGVPRNTQYPFLNTPTPENIERDLIFFFRKDCDICRYNHHK